MAPNAQAERAGLRSSRSTIETVNSQLESMGMQRLHASLLTLTCANAA